MSQRSALAVLLAVPVLMASAGFSQARPDFSGTWELTTIESDGKKIPAGNTFKETQIWVHQEPKLSVKIMTWNERLGYRTLELAFLTNGTGGPVGYRIQTDGKKAPVNGSAHWEGNQLVLEQALVNPVQGAPSRIIRSCTLDANGSKIVADTVYWMPGSDQRHQERWYWERKIGKP
jgi:hypothetical protein